MSPDNQRTNVPVNAHLRSGLHKFSIYRNYDGLVFHENRHTGSVDLLAFLSMAVTLGLCPSLILQIYFCSSYQWRFQIKFGLLWPSGLRELI